MYFVILVLFVNILFHLDQSWSRTSYRVPNTNYLAQGSWYKVPDTRYLVQGTWYNIQQISNPRRGAGQLKSPPHASEGEGSYYGMQSNENGSTIPGLIGHPQAANVFLWF